jgi:DNA segregation ATPase FtsK/SpoIIIE, S-DNA-T family
VPKHKASRHPLQAAAGAGLIAVAFLAGVALFPHQTAPIPRFVAARGGQLFGLGFWALPFLCLLFGLVVLVRRSFVLSGRLWGLAAAYLVTLGALHLRYPAGREVLAASGRKGGGYAGAVVSIALRRVAGEPGLWLALAGGAVAAVVLIWGLSLDELGQFGLTACLWTGRTTAAAGRALAAGVGGAAAALGAAVVWLTLRTLATLRELARALWRAGLSAERGIQAAVLSGAARIAAWFVAGAARTAKTVWTGTLRRRAPAPRAVPPVTPSVAPALPPASVLPEHALRAPVFGAGETADSAAEGLGAGRGSPDAAEGEQLDGHENAEPLRTEAPFSTEGSPADASPSKPSRRRRAGITQEPLPFPPLPGPAAPGRPNAAGAPLRGRAYTVPDLALLDAFAAKAKAGKVDPEEVARNLERTLASFGVEAKVIRWETGPVVTRYELQPAPGVKVQKITSLQNDIALSLAASSVRLEAPIPGKSAIGVELPNERPSLVHLREILATEEFARAQSPLAVAVGKGIAGTPVVADLVQMPHLLIAGATGAGKSVALNAMIASILFRATPEQARFLMIDPKRVELTNYNGIPHLLSPVVTGPREAAAKLRWAIQEMESRYEMFAKDSVRNIQAFNANHPDRPLAFILIIIDELADLMMVAPADFEEIICRLAQMTRATGIHLLIATQRPSVDVITGLIKANIPSRVAFSVSSQVDSRTILDHPGAEKLLGRGDMLFAPLGAARPIRVQGAFIGDGETERLVQFWRAQGEPAYVDALLQATPEEAAEESGGADALLADAARLVVRAGYASVSLLQRKMRIGYVRAARLVDQLEERGIVGPSQGSSPRELLAGLDDLDRILRAGSAQPARAAVGADEVS